MNGSCDSVVDHRLTVYTVSCSRNVPGGLKSEVIGSYLDRGDAIRDCADLIIEKLESDSVFRWSFMLQYDTPKILASKGVSSRQLRQFMDIRSVYVMPPRLKDAVREHLIDIIGGDSCYVTTCDRSGCGVQSFDVSENDVYGVNGGLKTWTCITSGRSTRNDPDFCDPFPEVFLDVESAVGCAMGDLALFLVGVPEVKARRIRDEARMALETRGHYEFTVAPCECRIWDIWSTPMNIGSSVAKPLRVRNGGE